MIKPKLKTRYYYDLSEASRYIRSAYSLPMPPALEQKCIEVAGGNDSFGIIYKENFEDDTLTFKERQFIKCLFANFGSLDGAFSYYVCQ